MKAIDELDINPAPWRLDDRYGYVHGIFSANNNCIVETDGGFYPPRMNDARLIAAAPELYEALRKTLVALKNRLPSQPTLDEIEIVDRAATALAAASGESEGAQ